MLQIRSVTLFAETPAPELGRIATDARDRLIQAGYPVQSLRLALANTPQPLDPGRAHELEARTRDAGFAYLSLGSQPPSAAAAIIAATERVFCSTLIAPPGGRYDRSLIGEAARGIKTIADGSEHGFGNLRYCVSACVAPGAPFFPAAYHAGGRPGLAVAVEVAGLALMQLRAAANLETGIAELTAAIEAHAAVIEPILSDTAQAAGSDFLGCDWSLAPHPAPERSTGAAIEALSQVPFGHWGTLAAVAMLTRAIRAARVRHTGFSGVMLPVLEDATLAQRNQEGCYRLRDLLAFSAVCGTGLDTIPLAGDVPVAQIAGILSEMAGLATTLNKPLTARLMPVPGLRTGEMTTFDFDYFVNTTTMTLD
jgi:uncharacterized protein (UPF0210 family)